jgi:hypothetical protein
MYPDSDINKLPFVRNDGVVLSRKPRIGEIRAMYIEDGLIDNVFYFYRKVEVKEGGPAIDHAVATGFLVTHDDRSAGGSLDYLVTGRHVIEGFITANQPVVCRFNTLDGGFAGVTTDPQAWCLSTDADVAVLALAVSENDAIAFGNAKGTAWPSTEFLSKTYCCSGKPHGSAKEGAGSVRADIGDELFSLGLFSQDSASQSGENLPIARFGHIARMPSLVSTPLFKGSKFKSYAYLVEFLSWGGMSGSPVFWYRNALGGGDGSIQIFHSTDRITKAKVDVGEVALREYGIVKLLGLVCGHRYIRQEPKKPDGERLSKSERFVIEQNSGIAVVTPAHQITSLLNREDVAEYRKTIIENSRELGEHPTSLDVSDG